MLDLIARPRRNRRTAGLRAFARETELRADRFVYPVFIHGGQGKQPIASMPGCARLSLDELRREAAAAFEDGVRSMLFFPAIPETLKTQTCEEALQPGRACSAGDSRAQKGSP